MQEGIADLLKHDERKGDGIQSRFLDFRRKLNSKEKEKGKRPI